MDFFTTIIWVFFGGLISTIYGVLMARYVSNGKHIWGMPIQQEKYQSVKSRYKTVLVVLILITFVVPFIVPKPKEDPNAWKTEDNSSMAYVMMQGFVKEDLKSPASAKFAGITNTNCKITKDGFDYTISSWVDSQNSFGAMIRTRFTGIVRQTDKDNWGLVDLEFEE